MISPHSHGCVHGEGFHLDIMDIGTHENWFGGIGVYTLTKIKTYFSTEFQVTLSGKLDLKNNFILSAN